MTRRQTIKELKRRLADRGRLFDPCGVCEQCHREAGRRQIAADLYECQHCGWTTRDTNCRPPPK